MSKARFSTRMLTTLALLTAIEIVLSRFLSVNAWNIKIGFSFVPVVVAAILYGPIAAGIVAALGDFVGAILFPMANPTPEIMPDLAKSAGAAVVGTGRSDYPNQINNVLAFPGIFRGALDVRAREINEQMKLAAAHALADLVLPAELSTEYILPRAFDPRVGPAVAAAVAKAARESGVAQA